jgi:hypothetical protein
MMITQRRSHSISQNAKVDDEETPMMSMMNPLVEDNDDDGGYNEDGKMNVIGVEHGDLYNGDDEADSSRVLFVSTSTTTLCKCYWICAFVFVYPKI